MDSNRLEELLQKYWNAETSLEEEQQLRTFFAREPVPEFLKETAALFRYFDEQKKLGVDDGLFEKELRDNIRPKGKVISLVQVARIAAGVLVVVAATYFIRKEVRKAYPSTEEITAEMNEDTYTDPKQAFEETKKALMMISKSFNKGQKQASKINVFNEATEKIQKHKEDNDQEKKTNI